MSNNTDEKAKQSALIVQKCALTAALTGAVPIPIADAPILISNEIMMMGMINSRFGISIKKDTLLKVLTIVLGVSGTTIVGKTIVSSMLKIIPIGGQVAGAAISSGTAAVLTYALGSSYIEVCKYMLEHFDDFDKGIQSKETINIFKEKFKEHMKLAPQALDTLKNKTKTIKKDGEIEIRGLENYPYESKYNVAVLLEGGEEPIIYLDLYMEEGELKFLSIACDPETETYVEETLRYIKNNYSVIMMREDYKNSDIVLKKVLNKKKNDDLVKILGNCETR